MSCHTFHHTFTGNVTCTVIFDPAAHYDRKTRKLSPLKYWDPPEPSAEELNSFFPEYREWMHAVNSQISQLIKSDHIFVSQDSFAEPPYREFWLYKLDGTKQCIKKEYGTSEAW